MSEQNENSVSTTAPEALKLLTIGAIWDNSQDEKVLANPKAPKMKGKIDANLGFEFVKLARGSELMFFKNENKGEKGPDFRVAINLPASIVDKEVARQRALRPATPAASVTV
jgi:hypothetical protein